MNIEASSGRLHPEARSDTHRLCTRIPREWQHSQENHKIPRWIRLSIKTGPALSGKIPLHERKTLLPGAGVRVIVFIPKIFSKKFMKHSFNGFPTIFRPDHFNKISSDRALRIPGLQ